MNAGEEDDNVDGSVIVMPIMHARPAAVLVKLAHAFEAEIILVNGKHEADAKSILSILTLNAPNGAEVHVKAEGPDADEAVQAMVEFFKACTFYDASGEHEAAPCVRESRFANAG